MVVHQKRARSESLGAVGAPSRASLPISSARRDWRCRSQRVTLRMTLRIPSRRGPHLSKIAWLKKAAVVLSSQLRQHPSWKSWLTPPMRVPASKRKSKRLWQLWVRQAKALWSFKMVIVVPSQNLSSREARLISVELAITMTRISFNKSQSLLDWAN